MDYSDLLISFVWGLIWSLIWGFATAAVREKKGYGRKWFWFGFFLGLVPFIIACAIPAKQMDAFQNYTPGGLKQLIAAKGNGKSEQSQFADEEYVRRTVANGGWQCSCGRANQAYVSTCSCGQNKRQNTLSGTDYTGNSVEKTEQQDSDTEL